MLATLCSYESWLGPYHLQTLGLMAQIAVTYWQAGEPHRARPLLERVVRDVGRYFGRDHDLRLEAIVNLRDLLVAHQDYERAGAIQRELLECQVRRFGRDHPETLAARDNLAMILLKNVACNSTAEA
jgi:Tetratricopeptide repeat